MMFSSKKFDLETMASLHVCNNEDGLMDEWIDQLLDGWVCGGINGWIDGWIDDICID